MCRGDGQQHADYQSGFGADGERKSPVASEGVLSIERSAGAVGSATAGNRNGSTVS
jgi:hypothetical protein